MHKKLSGDIGNRTRDLFHAKEALYQLSHAPFDKKNLLERPEELQ